MANTFVATQSHGASADSRCPRLARPLQPQNVSVVASVDATVVIAIDNLPTPTQSTAAYECLFGDSDVATTGTFSAPNTITCRLPNYDQRPRVRNADDHVAVPLKLRSTATKRVFFEERFIFFDCTAQQL